MNKKLLEQRLESYLKANPEDSENLVRYAIFLHDEPSISDSNKSIDILTNLLNRDPQNIRALLVLSDIQGSTKGKIDETTFNLLSNFQTKNSESLSMIEYLKARYYFDEDKKQRKQALVKSVRLCSKHVNNNKELGEIYILDGEKSEGCALIKRALKNILCISPEVWPYIKKSVYITSVDNFIDYFIKGTYNTQSNLQNLGHLYITSCPIPMSPENF
jgi:hypothetical protein